MRRLGWGKGEGGRGGGQIYASRILEWEKLHFMIDGIIFTVQTK